MKAGDTLRFIAVDESTGKSKFLEHLPLELHRVNGDLVATGAPATYRRADPKDANHWLVDTSTLTFDVR